MEGRQLVETTYLTLAEDGIFPVTKDGKGKILPQKPASGFPFAGTIQGEGKLNGIPSIFIRLAGCNLHCNWKTEEGGISPCDTAYASYAVKNTQRLPVEEICAVVTRNTGNIRHVVLTGGEPFLQAQPRPRIARELNHAEPGYHITIEPNATLYDESLAGAIDFFSLSPKLSGSVPPPPFDKAHKRLRLNPEALNSLILHARKYGKDFQLKFVYSREADTDEIKSLLSQIKGWKNEDILLMPLGATKAELQKNSRNTLAHCIKNGWRYCDRLHVSLFGSQTGV